MKKYLFIATALVALASCSDDTFVGENSPNEANGNGAISFGFNVPNITRSSTSTDATTLNNQFIVWGEKNEAQSAAGAAPTNGNLVFLNYIVNYVASSANTTTSNTNGWEYVGFKFDDESATIPTTSYTTNVNPNTKPTSGDIPAQTIKYWDDNATSYTFTAVSALPADISAGRVSIKKTTSGSDVYSKGYTVTLAKTTESNTDTYPSLTNLYFADRVNIPKGDGYSHAAVQFNFRNSLSQIRAGIYETVPGYNISSIKFYVNTSGENPEQKEEAKVGETSAFGAVCDNSTTDNFEGTITVTYYSSGTDVNKPILTVTPNSGVQKTNLILGTNLRTISTSSLLSETTNQPSWDKADGEYTAVLPQNTTNALKLKCDYTLYNPTTKETINITGKTAEIPAQYLQWKANYKYSYIFKITDNELTPITFDAVVVTDEIGNAEYITTVSEPSITTFGVKSGVYTTGKNEYEVGSDIYVAVTDNGTVQTPTVGTNVNVYVATTSDATNFPITETSVANAITNTTITPIQCTAITNSNYTSYFDAEPAQATEVPGEDGKCISVAVTTQPEDWSTNYANYFTDKDCTQAVSSSDFSGTVYKKWTDALKLSAVKDLNKPTYYVIEYVKGSNKYYKVIKVVAAPSSGD